LNLDLITSIPLTIPLEQASGSRYEKNNNIILEISDDGTGLFKHINNRFHFDDIREVMLKLSKGKLTTDSINHTGEGIFFSSLSYDILSITENGYCYERNNLENDWSFCSVKKSAGTKIKMIVQRNTKINLTDVFLKYQDDETVEFNKTDIVIVIKKSMQLILALPQQTHLNFLMILAAC